MIFQQEPFGKSQFHLLTDWSGKGLASQFWHMESDPSFKKQTPTAVQCFLANFFFFKKRVCFCFHPLSLQPFRLLHLRHYLTYLTCGKKARNWLSFEILFETLKYTLLGQICNKRLNLVIIATSPLVLNFITTHPYISPLLYLFPLPPHPPKLL